ncbi:MAG TPA: hypothetical protein VM686_42930, partial [Polyangiaceae bacterium]|nr:hypothetical protein [Polyangiaceae bacterium]
MSTAAPASAQERVPESNGDGMDTHLFRPAVDSKGFFSVNGTDIIGKNDYSFGLVLDYGRNIMRTRSDRVPTGEVDPDGDPGVMGECEDEECLVDQSAMN